MAAREVARCLFWPVWVVVERAMVCHQILSSEVFGNATDIAIRAWLRETLAGDTDVSLLPLTFDFGR
jgi:hypothetical protein